MTIASAANRASYNGNGSSTNFTIPFAVLDASFLRVTLRDNNPASGTYGQETAKLLTTNYTLSGNLSEPGSTLTMLVAPPTGYVLMISGNITPSQDLDASASSTVSGSGLEAQLDKGVRFEQEVKDFTDRAVKLSEGIPTSQFDPTLPNDVDLTANATLIVNDTKTGWKMGPSISTLTTQATAAATSATNAANSATAAAASASAAAGSASAAAGSVTSASTQATNASNSATAAAASASAAATSATSAATQASAASGSASAAATSASGAATSASAAASSATAASTTAATLKNFREGSGVPSNSLGLDGDSYFDYLNKKIYERVSGSYVLRADFTRNFIMGTLAPGSADGKDGDAFFAYGIKKFYDRTAGVWTERADVTPVWLIGSGIPLNTLGKDGDTFFATNTKYMWKKTAGTWSIVADLSVASGGSGTSVRFGSGVPANVLGSDGDTYINTLTGDFYNKVAGAYVLQYSDIHPVNSVFGRTGTVVAASGDYTAAQVANTPAGNISSTTVQDALNELQGDIDTNTTNINTNTSNIATNTTNIAANTTAIALKAPIASPTFTGTPAAPTPSAGDNSTKVATTAYADGAVGTLNTSVNSALALKAPLASPALTGIPTAPTAAAGTNTTQVATTAYVDTGLALKAPLASPALTGTPTAPTAAGGTNTTQVATTAFVAASFAPLASPALTGTPTAPTAAGGTNTTQIATTAFVAASFAPIASPALTGTPTVPTAATGTNTTQAASTAFVQQELTGRKTSSTFSAASVTPGSNIEQSWAYTGSSGAVAFTGFGTLAGLTNGMVVTLFGTSDTNYLTLTESDATNGWLMNGTLDLTRGRTITFEYNTTVGGGRMVEIART